jgi:uncharacterized membrane protein
MNPLIFKIKYQGHRVILVATGSCFAVHIVTFLPITEINLLKWETPRKDSNIQFSARVTM